MNSESEAGALGIRPAEVDDAHTIATLYDIASDGVALYIWESMQRDHPGLGLIEIGAERFRDESTAYSYRNCLLADVGDEIAGMVHGWVMPESVASRLPNDFDPVIRPFAELEAPGTFYISAVAIFSAFRNRGIGSRLLQVAQERGNSLGADRMSLICFAENTGARALYERHGFEVVDSRAIVPHRYIRVTGDALLMVQRD